MDSKMEGGQTNRNSISFGVEYNDIYEMIEEKKFKKKRSSFAYDSTRYP